MLITPRTYSASQIPDRGSPLLSRENSSAIHSLTGWNPVSTGTQKATTETMLLLHQAGSVRVGEVVRFVESITAPPILYSILAFGLRLEQLVDDTDLIFSTGIR